MNASNTKPKDVQTEYYQILTAVCSILQQHMEREGGEGVTTACSWTRRKANVERDRVEWSSAFFFVLPRSDNLGKIHADCSKH